jgi:hypothetical protein
LEFLYIKIIPDTKYYILDTNLGMLGIDSLNLENLQVEHDIGLVNPYIKIISANLFSKVKQAFQPVYASALA